jgi:hypothetical protein
VHVSLNRGHLTTDWSFFNQQLESEPGMLHAEEHQSRSSSSFEYGPEFQPSAYGTASGGTTPVHSYPGYDDYEEYEGYCSDESIMTSSLVHDQMDASYTAGDQTNPRLQQFYGNDVQAVVNNPEFEGGTYPNHDSTAAQEAIDAYSESDEQEIGTENQETEHSIEYQPPLPPIGLADPIVELSGPSQPLNERDICPNCGRDFADLR